MRTIGVTIVCAVMLCGAAWGDDLSLTVYNTDLAVVRTTREMGFEKGVQVRTFVDVPQRIDPTSVRFAAESEGITLVEQNYRYDLAGSENVLRRYIDRDIDVLLEEGMLTSGTLLSVADDIVLRTAEGIEIVRKDSVERYSFPELPEGLVSRPTLFWTIESDNARTVPVEISYMTDGFGWHAEYTAVLGDDDETTLALSSWVSIDNQSGATFTDATLKLVAGDVNRVSQPVPQLYAAPMDLKVSERAAGFEERGLYEYHLYELQGLTTLANAEIKQITLFPETTVAAKRLLVFDTWEAAGVQAKVEFENSADAGLGIPLPAGTFRVFQRDTDGAMEFVGEDRIEHTPRNETVRATVGTVFDIAAERRVMTARQITDRVREETVEIVFRNRRDDVADIIAVEHLSGTWEIQSASSEYTRKDAGTIEFEVRAASDEELTITYTVRYRY